MLRFLISYDLIGGKEEEYKDLKVALKAAGAGAVQKSVWCLNDPSDRLDCEVLRDLFWKHMKTGDRLLVVRFVDGWSGYNSITKITDC